MPGVTGQWEEIPALKRVVKGRKKKALLFVVNGRKIVGQWEKKWPCSLINGQKMQCFFFLSARGSVLSGVYTKGCLY